MSTKPPKSAPNPSDANMRTAAEVSTPSSEVSSQVSSTDTSRAPTPRDTKPEEKMDARGKNSEWELSAKIKKTVKPTGSILSLKATTSRARLQDIFSLNEGSKSRQPSPAPESRTASKIEDDKVLVSLLC